MELATIAKVRATHVVFVSMAAIRDVRVRRRRPSPPEALGLSDLRRSTYRARGPACANRPTLLVLDNFEHLLDAVTLVADFLTSVPLPRLLVHEPRAAASVRGERDTSSGL